MWFLFGFITIFSFSIFFIYKRIQKNWKAYTHNYKGREYILGGNNSKSGFLIGCESKVDLKIDLTIKRETVIDKFFKFIGLSVECQVDCKEFDNKFYIVTEDKKLCSYLKSAKHVQDELSKLLQICEENSLKFKSFNFRGNRLWVDIKKSKKDSNKELIIPCLFNLLDFLAEDAESIKGSELKDKFILKAGIILSISSASLITAVLLMLSSEFGDVYYLVETGALVNLSFFIASFFIFAFVIIIIYILGRSSRTHLVLIEVLIIGYIGFTLLTFIGLEKVNIDYDNSRPEIFTSQITKKHISRSRRGGSSYYFYLSNWKNHNEIKKVRVSNKNYNNFKSLSYVSIYLKKGRVYIPWISNIKNAPINEEVKLKEKTLKHKIAIEERNQRVIESRKYEYEIDDERKNRLLREEKLTR